MQILGNSKLSKKFQVTIPRDVMDTLHLTSGGRLVFVGEKDRVLLKRGELLVSDFQIVRPTDHSQQADFTRR